MAIGKYTGNFLQILAFFLRKAHTKTRSICNFLRYGNKCEKLASNQSEIIKAMKIKICLATIIFSLCSLQFASAQRSHGVINGKATYLPKPDYPQGAKDFCASGKVNVQVLIDEGGNVIAASVIMGDELLRDSAIEAAKQAKFRQTDDIKPVKVTGIIVYNFIPEQKCINAGIVNKNPIDLVKPPLVSCNCKFSDNLNIYVKAAIDEQGNVIKATALSGHPILQLASEKAARSSKILPKKSSVIVLVYKFTKLGKWSVKCSGVEIVKIKINK